ncbi:hypothetical protein KBA63_00830 [Candidatus Woesebacteria bacterium]|jgi:hypothetical protein|nr:hypothetical protein [Candidatus Woesebacteria bacterium]MBP9687429.1 hypothetical protein [Candidatus Woesebacteria bacterium]
MNNLKFELLSLSNDLGRISVSIHRDSTEAAKRFCEEGVKYCQTPDSTLPIYIRDILSSLKSELVHKQISAVDGERYLVRSIQLQNFALKEL